jgi:hypothetical protein
MLQGFGIFLIFAGVIGNFTNASWAMQSGLFIAGLVLSAVGRFRKNAIPPAPQTAPVNTDFEAQRGKALANLVSLNANGRISDSHYERASRRLNAVGMTGTGLALLAAVAAIRQQSDNDLHDTGLFNDSWDSAHPLAESSLSSNLFRYTDVNIDLSDLDCVIRPSVETSSASSRINSALFEDTFSADDSSFCDDNPSFNVDGTPMMGCVDIHGNPYGVTDSDFDWNSSTSDFDSGSSSDD